MHNRHGAFSIYVFLNTVSSLCYSMILTIELIYQARVGLNPFQLVFAGSLQQFVVFVSQPPTGAFADMYSRRWAIVLGFFLVGLGYLIEGVFPIVPLVFVSVAIVGLGVTLVNGADAAWIADEMGPEHVGQVYMRAAQYGSLASLLGITASAVLLNFRLNLPIVLGGSLLLLLSIILAILMPERHFTPIAREGRNTFRQMIHILRAGVQLIRLRPVLLTVLGVTVFYGIYSIGFDRLWPYYLQHQFTFPALGRLSSFVWFCLIEAGIVLTNWLGIEIARRCVDTKNHRSVAWALFLINGLQILCIVGFALAGQFVLALALFWLFTVVVGPRTPLVQAWMNQNLTSNVRATVLSLQGQVQAIVQIAFGPIMGIIATTFSTRTALITSAIVLSPALLLYMYTLRRKKPITSSE